MKIGVFDHGWWRGACDATSHKSVTLPVASHPSGNAYAADLRARLANGAAAAELLANESVDLLAAVHADMPDLTFHKIYYDLYQFDDPADDLTLSDFELPPDPSC